MRILLAYDGQPASDGAVRLAMQLCQETSASVEVIRVLEPYPVYGSELVHGPWTVGGGLPEGRGQWAMEEIRGRLQEYGGVAAEWPIRLELGPVPFIIARAAAQLDISLIVMGLGKHDRLDRWFGTETALRVMQIAHVPVLAVPPGVRSLPRSVVAAVDFSDFSRDAIAQAIPLCAPGADLHVVHVLWQHPSDVGPLGEFDRPQEVKRQVREQLQDWLGTIEGIERVNPQIHLREGSIAGEALSLAAAKDAEMIVAGSHGMGFLGRLMLGSVSTRLMRGANCPVLIAPPRERARELEKPSSALAEAS
jgi:nucleotide-binding universal stress UspA family protein